MGSGKIVKHQKKKEELGETILVTLITTHSYSQYIFFINKFSLITSTLINLNN